MPLRPAFWGPAAEILMNNSRRRGRMTASVLFALIAVPLAADEPSRTVRVVAGPQYRAGGFHRMMLGRDYRALWTTPITVEVLDLQRFAGGLTPGRRGRG